MKIAIIDLIYKKFFSDALSTGVCSFCQKILKNFAYDFAICTLKSQKTVNYILEIRVV